MITSFMSDDRRRRFCVCEAPSPEAIRRAAGRYQWHVDAITRVSVIDAFRLRHDRQRRLLPERCQKRGEGNMPFHLRDKIRLAEVRRARAALRRRVR
jgi:hypothetical protein